MEKMTDEQLEELQKQIDEMSIDEINTFIEAWHANDKADYGENTMLKDEPDIEER